MKKKIILIVFILGAITPGFYSFSQNKKETDIILNSDVRNDCEGDKIFNAHVQECLEIMEITALKYSEKGVAVISFVPGTKTEYWNSRMKVIGALSNQTHNFLAVACAKSSEMALTLQNSGSVSKVKLIGELGYKGGVIKKVACGYLIASFSGAPAEIDTKISNVAVDFLSKFY